MGPTIAATVYASAAIVAAYFFKPRFISTPAILRAALFWLASTPSLFLISNSLAALFVCGVLLAALTPRSLDDRAAYYIIAVAAVPLSVVAAIPFPGINYLMILDFAKIACAVLLLPIVILSKKPLARRYAPTAGVLLLIFTALYCALEFRSANLTSGLRASVDDILLFALPFMAILRLISERAQIEKVFSAFIFLAVIFFFAATFTQITSWNYYTFLIERHGQSAFADYREGILRAGVTVVPILVGYVMTLGLICVEYFRALKRAGSIATWLYRGMFVIAAMLTYSRGAWLALAVGYAAFIFFTKAPRSLRPAAIVLALLVGAPVAATFVMTADFSGIDEYGTFAYRRELLRASFVQISEHPIFGDPHFLDSGNFDHLYTGMGLIDVVNYYLKIALGHGLVGLGLYLSAFATAIIGLLNLGKRTTDFGDARAMEHQRAVILAAVASYLAMAATISAVSMVEHFGVLVLALATAYLAAARAELDAAPPKAAPAEAGPA
ncbi:MAG: O-antigen ligase family protein [Parvularculaceae bacterium]